MFDSDFNIEFLSKKVLPLSYYLNDDVVFLAKDLLGKAIFTLDNHQKLTGGMITETEAYQGPEDRASHAWNNRRTQRTEPMFRQGGIAYVYLCYGIHKLFNIVTNKEDIPHAILLRGIEPICGIDIMQKRRNKKTIDKKFSDGPGTAALALGIDMTHNAESLLGPKIWICDFDKQISPDQILARPRIGVGYAGDDALLPWNFKLRS